MLILLLLVSAVFAQSYSSIADTPCATVRCASGFECKTQQVQCIRAPCPPQPVCTPIPSAGPCATKVCLGGQNCEVISAACSLGTSKCPQTAVCKDACSSNPCGEGTTCVVSPKQCIIAPCPQFDCVPTYVPTPSTKGVFQIIKGGEYGSKFVYHLVNGDGDHVLSSVTAFDTEQACAASAESVRVNGIIDDRWSTDAGVLSLKAANGQVIATSDKVTDTATLQAAIIAILKTNNVKTLPPISSSVGIGRFEIFYDIAGQYRFRLVAANGEIILASEGYTVKASALKGIASVRVNSVDEIQFKKLDSKDSQFYFNLIAKNNEVIGTSEMYRTVANRAIGIFSVQRNAAAAEVADLTIGVAKPTPGAKYTVYQEIAAGYRFRLDTTSGVNLLTSPSYDTADQAKTALASAKTAVASTASYTSNAAEGTSNYVSVSAASAVVGYSTPTASSYTSQIQAAAVQYGGTADVDDQTTTRKPHFVIFCGKCKKACYYFHLKAANGEIILASESYTSKQSAQTGIASVKTNSAMTGAFNKLVAKDGKPYFTLEAKNGETIGVSETYSSTSARDYGIDAVTRNAALADTVDEATPCAIRESEVIKPSGYVATGPGGAKREDDYAEDDTEAPVDGSSSASSVTILLSCIVVAVAALF